MSSDYLLHLRYASYAGDPLGFARDVLGFRPSPKQAQVLNALIFKGILCCTRGFGKTEITAVLAVWHLATRPGALVLVVSETAEKAAELVQRVFRYLELAGITAVPDKLRKNGYRTVGGGRILPVPSRDGAVRGYPATMILIDEAAVVSDKVWMAICGTRATTFQHARVWIMSTPGPRQGFFFDIWHSSDATWTRIHATAYDCEHIPREFVEECRLSMHEDDFERELMARFCAVGKELFRLEDWRGRVTPRVKPLSDGDAPPPPPPVGQKVFTEDGAWVPRQGFIAGIDLGQAHDRAAIAVVEYRLDPLNRRDAVSQVWLHTMKLELRWLELLPVNTSYVDVAGTIEELVNHPEMDGRVSLVVDATGVGRPFFDQLKAMKLKAPVLPVQITGGLRMAHEHGMMNVPKVELVLTLEAYVRYGKVEVAAECPLLRELERELMGVERIRKGSGRTTYSGKMNGGSDDLVMAFALAVWAAREKLRTGRRRDLREECGPAVAA